VVEQVIASGVEEDAKKIGEEFHSLKAASSVVASSVASRASMVAIRK
jgi:hypothetical protein